MKRSTLRSAAVALLLGAATPVLADETATPQDSQQVIEDLRRQLEDLDQKVKILERKDELNDEEAAKRKKENPQVRIDDKGLTATSADKRFRIRLRGLLQLDSRWFLDAPQVSNNNPNEAFLLRRARPYIEGYVFENIEYRFMPEFGGSATPTILDAYLNFNYAQEANVRVGKFKSPVSLEQLQSDADRTFVEGSPVLNLVPNRDLGVMVHGEIEDGLFSYSVGAFNGAADGANVGWNDPSDNKKEIAARVFSHPFRATDIIELHGLGLGAGGSYGDSSGTGSLTSGYRTFGQQTWFQYNNTVSAFGQHTRLAPGGYYYYGPFGVMGEYVIDNQQLLNQVSQARTGSQRYLNAQNEAWQVSASYVITGEDASYKGVKPKNPLNFNEGGWGAWEIAGRYGETSIDSGLFTGANPFVTSTTSASGTSEWGIGLNWYLNSNVRASFDFFQTDFKAANGRGFAPNSLLRDPENAFITRLQLNF